ncbi:hypothetical protein NE865_00365 [Phthorimaea operculella]|nr:hypothetical protein NE865_00365 [Phthorimaea operculella]
MTVTKTWSQFSATRRSDGNTLKFRIVEATQADHTDILIFMENYYINSEMFNKTTGIDKNKDAMTEMFHLYNLTGSDKRILLCYLDQDLDDTSTIVGVSMASLETISDEDKLAEVILKVKTPEVKHLLNISVVLKDLTGGMKTLGVEKWYNVSRISVHPDFTGLGIAKEFLKAWRLMSKNHNVQAACAWMTAIGTQKAAERDGWSTYYEIPFVELARHCQCEFKDAPPTFKAMVAYTD